MRYLLFLVSSKNFVFCKLPLEWVVTLRLCADLLISADKISKFSPHRQEHITKKFQDEKKYLNVSNEWNKMWMNVILFLCQKNINYNFYLDVSCNRVRFVNFLYVLMNIFENLILCIHLCSNKCIWKIYYIIEKCCATLFWRNCLQTMWHASFSG